MGNRAVITTQDKDLGIYLHWNGGFDSVNAFLTYCKIKGYRTPETDNYGWARLCQVIGNWIGGELSLGIDRYDRLDTDNGDNGVYIIKDWEIIGREFAPDEEQNVYDLFGMVCDINNAQPTDEQLTGEELQKKFYEIRKQTITVKQIKAIHAIKNELKLTDYRYKQILKFLFKVESCKDLNDKQASVLIETLNKLKEVE